MSSETGREGTTVGGTLPAEAEKVVDVVRDRYARIAEGTSCGCGCLGEAGSALAIGYSEADLATLPDGANLGLGCGAPVEALRLVEGETVLDLGSGAGVDAFLAARRVGPRGKVIGVDMTSEMVEKARAHAAKAGFDRVEFREGRLEALPVADASVDAVTSNCVINLVPDKAKVFREIARVLKPGGRLVVSDILLDGRLPETVERDVMAYVGCVAGAMDRREYFALLAEAGLGDVRVLTDVDYLEAAGYRFAPEVLDAMGRTDIDPSELAGKIRSVTYRAARPARGTAAPGA